MTELIERKKITIVGAGYVGMSIAVALAVKEDVLILESNKEKIDRINSGKPSINDSDINLFCHDQSFSIKATDNFARILSGTLILTIFLYVLVNIGMVIGLLPTVGAPLPFMSYGGTSMLTVFAALGIIMSVKSHQRLMRK